MAGIASAAIIGGLGLAGSLGAGLLGSGGARAGSAQAGAAGQQAYAAGQAQIDRNTSNASPYTAGGISALSQIGALLGYGNLSNPGGEGGVYNFNGDPNAYGNALSQVKQFAGASGATIPGYNVASFTPSNVVSQNFQADPSYAFRLSQGQGALDADAAAKGTLLSGAQQQAVTNYGQNAASQEYQNWYQRLMGQNNYNLQGNLATNAQGFGEQQQQYADQTGQWSNALAMLTGLAGMGNTATSSLAGANTGATGAAGNALTGTGIASAGLTNQAGTDLASGVGSGVSNALQAYLLRNAFGNNGQGGGSSSYIPTPGGTGPTSIGGQPISYYTG